MKTILKLAALGEFATGLLLLVYPPIVIRVLFAAEITGAGVFMSRIAGISLIALAAACWPNGKNTARALVAMLTYSTLAMLYLIVLGIGGTGGLGLWIGVLVHATLSVSLIWCDLCRGAQKLKRN